MEKNATTDWIRGSAATLIGRFLAPLNTRLKERNFILDEFSVCDIFLITSLGQIQHTQILSEYPNLQKYFYRCCERPAYKKALSENGRARPQEIVQDAF